MHVTKPTPPAFLGLTLKISEDAYLGDAYYQVSVDGVLQGGIRTASASHQAGQSDTVTISGNWDAGPHSVDVNFLNDVYAGSSSTDRNLYVESLSLGGVAAIGVPAALLGDGNVTFVIPIASVPPLLLPRVIWS